MTSTTRCRPRRWCEEAARRARRAMERAGPAAARCRGGSCCARRRHRLRCCPRSPRARSEERASQGRPSSRRHLHRAGSSTTSATSTATTLDPAAASSVLDRDGLVMDVQLHFLDPDRNTGGFGGGFPQAALRRPDPRLCFTQDVFLDLVFGQSDTRIGVLSGLPFAGRDGPLARRHDGASPRAPGRAGPRPAAAVQAPVFPATRAAPGRARRHGRRRRHLPGGGVEDLHARPRPVPAGRRARRRAAGPGRGARPADPGRPQGTGRRGAGGVAGRRRPGGRGPSRRHHRRLPLGLGARRARGSVPRRRAAEQPPGRRPLDRQPPGGGHRPRQGTSTPNWAAPGSTSAATSTARVTCSASCCVTSGPSASCGERTRSGTAPRRARSTPSGPSTITRGAQERYGYPALTDGSQGPHPRAATPPASTRSDTAPSGHPVFSGRLSAPV